MTMHDLGWMLGDVTSVKGVLHAVICTSDGLLKAKSEHIDKEVAERTAASCAGFQSLGRGTAAEFGASQTVRQVMVEYDGGFMFIRTAATGSCLAVVTGDVVDPGLVAKKMQEHVIRLGERNLSTPARQSPAP